MKTIDSTKTLADLVIAEVRHKSEIAEAFDCNVTALGRSLQQREIRESQFNTPVGEPDGGGKTATRPVVGPKSGDKPQHEAEGRSR